MHTLSLTPPEPPPTPDLVCCWACGWHLSRPTLAAPVADSHATPEPFIPTDYQRDILDALRGKSLRTNGLAAKLSCSSSRLFQVPGGLPELIAQGLVAHHKRIGFYRLDALPPELQRPSPVTQERVARP